MFPRHSPGGGGRRPALGTAAGVRSIPLAASAARIVNKYTTASRWSKIRRNRRLIPLQKQSGNSLVVQFFSLFSGLALMLMSNMSLQIRWMRFKIRLLKTSSVSTET